MVERITDPHRPVQIHGVGRIPDGHTVPQPPPGEPGRRAPMFGYPNWFWKGIGWVVRLTALTLVLGLYAVDPTTRPPW